MRQEERKHTRSPVLEPIEFVLAPSIIEKSYDGVITDISDSGACILTALHLKDRQRIILQDKSQSFEKIAIVRWSKKYDDYYKIGLEFIEDQTFLSIKDKRRYKRLNVEEINMTSKIAFDKYIKIIDISLGGLLIETDNNWNVGEEYILQVNCEGKQWPIRGYIIRSRIKEWRQNDQGNPIPIYRAGMKLTSDSNEIHDLLKLMRLKLKQGYIIDNFPSRLNETYIKGMAK